MGVDTKANASRGSGALEIGDLCLVEDGSKRNSALGSDAVVVESASEGQDGKGERVGACQRALTCTQANTQFERGKAYLSDSSVELPLSALATATPPSGPSVL